MTTNGVPLSQQWVSRQEELLYIRVLFHLDVRMMHLTYNWHNMLGDGCQESADAELRDLGQAAIREMNDVGVIIDVAHAGWRTCIEAAEISEKPTVASRSGAFALSAHRRCKTDEAIKAIVHKGGTIGICCIPHFLGRSGDINAFLDHVDYVAGKFGVDAVSIDRYGSPIYAFMQHTGGTQDACA